MTIHAVSDFDPTQLPLILEQLPVAVTVIDLKGNMLYYNEYSRQILDRKPEYLGKDIRQCHQQSESNLKIDHMLAEFKDGRRRAHSYEADRYGKRIAVTLSRFEVDGRLAGCIQSVIIKT